MPDDIDLGVGASVLRRHVACDLGAGPLAARLARELAAPLWRARWSRLVCDLNRPAQSDAIAPFLADGDPIPGNRGLAGAALARRRAIHRNFHAGLDARIAAQRPGLLVAVHSFTPQLRTRTVERPWPIGVLWNEDDRAARTAIPLLRRCAELQGAGAFSGPVGTNEPYSGKILNYSMNRHAEANGIPYLVVEVRQDLLATPAHVAEWAGILAPVVRALAARFAVGAARTARHAEERIGSGS